MKRPFVICHMVTSLDGRLLPERWPIDEDDMMALYEQVAEGFGADGWMVGSATMAHFMERAEPRISSVINEPRADIISDPDASSLAICFDRQGRLRPEGSDIEGDHLVFVVSEAVSSEHVSHLEAMGLSVVFSGPTGDDIEGALSRIGAAFDVTRLLLEGGGEINAAFLEKGLIDETSTILLPVIDGGRDVPGFYGIFEETGAQALELLSVEPLAQDAVWMHHRVVRTGA